MRCLRACLAIVAALVIVPVQAADGILIPGTSSLDMVHDFARDVIYITKADSVLRYQVSPGTFLPPFVLGGQLHGIDISPDGRWLAVADWWGYANGRLWVYLVDTRDGTVRKLSDALEDSYEGGTYSVAFGADGSLLVSSVCNCSGGGTPLRRFDIASGVPTKLAAMEGAMLSASGDRMTIGIAGSNNSGGPFAVYHVDTRAFGSVGMSGSFAFEIALDRRGQRIAMPTFFGLRVFDTTPTMLATLGRNETYPPVGVAYHPVEPLLYVAWPNAPLVHVVDGATFTEVATYDVGATFGWNGWWAYSNGRTKLSADGSLLMVTVAGGVRLIRQYASLAATDANATTMQEDPVDIALQGSVGNGGAVTYRVGTPPANGTVTISGAVATYTPNPGFYGTDTFTFDAVYGRAAAEAVATITVQRATVSPRRLVDFGGFSMAMRSPPRRVTVANTTGADVVVGPIALSGPFSQVSDCGSTLAPGAHCSIDVTFEVPILPGALNVRVAQAGTLSVTVGGTGHAVALAGVAEKSLATHYYWSILRRAPDAGGKAYWEGEAVRIAALDADPNEAWRAMSIAFFASPEYQALGRDDAAFVTDLYDTFFGRSPDAGGLAYWKDQLAQGLPRDSLLDSFMFSPEFSGFMASIFGAAGSRPEVDLVIDMYRGILKRLPDDAGLRSYVRGLRDAQCQGTAAVRTRIDGLTFAFVGSAEYAGRQRNDTLFTADLYDAFMRRGAELAGLAYHVQQLAAGEPREQKRREFQSSAEFGARVANVAAQVCMP